MNNVQNCGSMSHSYHIGICSRNVNEQVENVGRLLNQLIILKFLCSGTLGHRYMHKHDTLRFHRRF